jgi:hypothetical protein
MQNTSAKIQILFNIPRKKGEILLSPLEKYEEIFRFNAKIQLIL